MRDSDKNLVIEFGRMQNRPKPTLPVSEWVADNVRFGEQEVRGPFSFTGREYMRDCLNDANSPTADDFVYVFGTGVGKTVIFMAQAAWEMVHIQPRCLWVMPATDGAGGARRFCRTRLRRMIEETECLRDKIPKGAQRFDITSDSISINGSQFDFVGSNSPAQIAANRCSRVRQDEVDKFFKGSDEEASATYNADRRTDGVEMAKRFKCSSPTLASGLIWSTFWNKTDRQRYFVPCPHCDKSIVFAWSKKFTVFPLQGYEAFVKWDDSAKREDGAWDLDAVTKSTHMVCPHCSGKILDEHKFDMDKRGEWRATSGGTPRYRGRHLPAMYSTASKCSFGELAKEFLLALRSPEGAKGFINSRLAEPDVSQEVKIDRKSVVIANIDTEKEWVRVMSVDCQQNAPYFWWLIRAWKEGKTHGIACGSCDNWYELDEIQKQYGVKNECVIVDSGYGSKSDAEVYRNCAQRCSIEGSKQQGAAWCIGWMPSKSYGNQSMFRNPDTGVYQPVRIRPIDPYAGTSESHQCRIELVEFSAEYFEDVFENIRLGRTHIEYTISDEMNTETYHRHIAGKVKKVKYKKNGETFSKWETISQGFDDHLRACENLSNVWAWNVEILSNTQLKTKEKK